MEEYYRMSNAEGQDGVGSFETPEVILSFAQEQGYELTDEELEDITGGDWSPADALPRCPNCEGMAISMFPIPGATGMTKCVCHDCGWSWNRTPIG